jgi:uncharacterized protein YbcV (DUF1398 family)
MASSPLSQSIRAVWHKVHSAEGLPFPQTVSALMALGVTRYHIDYVASTATAYVPNAETGALDIDIADIPSHFKPQHVSAKWTEEGVVGAIGRVQKGQVTYAQFATQCIESGVTNYFACLEGKRVVYFGALGDVHVEWFPGAAPRK